MRLRMVFPALLLWGTAGCESILEIDPKTEVSEDNAIVDATSARAAVAGLYDALQAGSYYGGDYVLFSDLSADHVEHTGTFSSYGDADANDLRSDNGTIEIVWDDLYFAIGRANIVIARLADVDFLSDDEKSDMLAQARFIRALSYHNLVRLWGDTLPSGLGVPLRIEPPTTVGEASDIERATVEAVYDQILADLAAAEAALTSTGSKTATVEAVLAIRSRVYLYWGTLLERAGRVADAAAAFQAAEADAAALVASGDFDLAPVYADLFTPGGDPTDEDIFRLEFTPVDFNWIGYYYRSRLVGGRHEVTPTASLEAAYTAGDERLARNIAYDADGERYGAKYPTGIGAEDLHIIRYAEVLLNKAEAHARQNELPQALLELNKVRDRAGLADLVLGVDVTTQQEVIDAILHERMLELAYEGDRWPDLVRTGQVVAWLDAQGEPLTQMLYPIPLNEIDVTGGRLVQNAGY